MSCLSLCCHVFLPTLLPFYKKWEVFSAKTLSRSSFEGRFFFDASIGVFEGYWVQLVPRLPPFITVISPSLGARGEGILDGGGRVERVSGFRDRRKSKHESGITFTSSEFLLPFTQTVSLSI